MAIVTTAANALKSRPTTPPISSTGMNTAMSERVIETMVKPISPIPASPPRSGGMPASMWRMMFSSMTMASSTTSPTARVRPSSETLSTEKPSRYMAPQVAMREIGTASAGISVTGTPPQEEEDDQDAPARW